MVMNLRKYKVGRVQLFLSLLVWVLMFLMPVFFSDTMTGREWPHIFKIWREYSIVFLLFLINRYVLLPYLFFRDKRVTYFFSISGLLLLVAFGLYLQERVPIGEPRGPQRARPPMEGRFDPHASGHQLNPMPGGMRPLNPKNDFVPPFANLFIMSILLLGFDSGLIFSMKWMEAEQKKLKVEKESVENKMAFLQNQISPHFFMNTLNNIHALVDINAEEAKAAIIKLSQMMDYMLYESQTSAISIQRELMFITSYVELMKLRFTDDVDIVLDIPDNLPAIAIPPLLSISFIENAFKYGVSYESNSFIHIRISCDEKHLECQVSNSTHDLIKPRKNSGIGIANARKRLDLIFGNRYSLEINDGPDNIFDVKLNIPV